MKDYKFFCYFWGEFDRTRQEIFLYILLQMMYNITCIFRFREFNGEPKVAKEALGCFLRAFVNRACTFKYTGMISVSKELSY